MSTSNPIRSEASFEMQPGDVAENTSNDIVQENPNQGLAQELKPADRGRDAWVVLIAGFIFEALFWGFPMSFGVFQNYYSNVKEFEKDSDNIALIGTLAQGLYYLGAPFSAILTKRFPKYQRHQIWLGWPMCILGLLCASFASTVNGLIATQGLLYGLGFVILTYPIISMINEWWVVRKGMAFGLISAASGATGAVMPFILQALLDAYGHCTTLRACAVAMVFTAPLIPLFRGRLPPSEQSAFGRADWGFLKRPLFWVYGLAIFVQGLGFFFPIEFIPSYASVLNLPSIQGALLLAVMSIAQVIGQFVLGYLSDKKLSVTLLATSCCMFAAVASFVLWGLARSIGLLVAFSLVYGFFAFGFGTLRVAMGRSVSDDPSTVFSTYAIYVFIQGIGSILVGPTSARLMSSKAVMAHRYGAGKYDTVVIYTAVSSVVAAFIMVFWHGSRKVLKIQ